MANLGNQFRRQQAAGFTEFVKKMKAVDERTRRREVVKLLRREAGPIRTAMRKNAYKNAVQGDAKKEIRAGWTVFNLKRTIGIFPSKARQGDDFVFVNVGGRSPRKGGAPYFKPQNSGQFQNKSRFKGQVPKIKAKDFVKDTEQQLPALSAKMAKSVDKYLQRTLSKTFR
ncbi:MAG: hypothetical protein HRU12_02805 [Phaeodactylibacter sp.]|nr:hypothetical protein [Phaeodactylibacter sp.]